VDLRRAVSAAYYAVFHTVLRAVADWVVPASRRATTEYARVYRSIDHTELNELCKVITTGIGPKNKYAPHVPSKGFSRNILDFATAVIELQEKRHLADYDPEFGITRSDTLVTINTARTALTRFQSAPDEERAVFISLLIFPPRR
jgi:hypothetical protein